MLCGEGVVAYGYTLQRLVNVMEEESVWKRKPPKKTIKQHFFMQQDEQTVRMRLTSTNQTKSYSAKIIKTTYTKS